MAEEPTGSPAAEESGEATITEIGESAPASSSPSQRQAPTRQRSSVLAWEAVVGISTAAGVVITLLVGLPNLLGRDSNTADRPPPAAASTGTSPSSPHPSIAVLSPAYGNRVAVTCVKAACAIEVRGRSEGAGPSLHPYVLIAHECCPGSAAVYYVQWDSTQQTSAEDWVSRAYVAKPQAGTTFLIKAVLATSPIRPSASGDDLVIWSDAMADKFGVVADSSVVTVKVASIVEATAFCECP